jgi:hypothetical protein
MCSGNALCIMEHTYKHIQWKTTGSVLGKAMLETWESYFSHSATRLIIIIRIFIIPTCRQWDLVTCRWIINKKGNRLRTTCASCCSSGFVFRQSPVQGLIHESGDKTRWRAEDDGSISMRESQLGGDWGRIRTLSNVSDGSPVRPRGRDRWPVADW